MFGYQNTEKKLYKFQNKKRNNKKIGNDKKIKKVILKTT